MHRLSGLLVALSVFGLLACDSSTCVPESDQAFCDGNGRNCGEYTGFDQCGASRTVACGTCEAPEVCGGGGTNVCGLGAADAGTDAGGLADGGTDAGTDAGPPPSMTLAFRIDNNPNVVNGNPSTDAFDGVEGADLTLVVGYASLAAPVEGGDSFMGYERTYDLLTPSYALTGSSSTAAAMLETDLSGGAVPTLQLVAPANVGTPTGEVEASFRAIPPSPMPSVFRWVEVAGCTSGLSVEADGRPSAGSFSCNTTVTLRRVSGGTMTDYASGPGMMTFIAP